LDGNSIINTPPQQSDKDYTPKPANEWIESGDEKRHAGDLYYDKSTGFCYRWLYEEKDNESTYYWIRITDSDITNALAAADKAQATANGKMDYFMPEAGKHPAPPYKVGDLWINATYEDKSVKYINALLVCIQKNENTNYEDFSINDWTTAADYLTNEELILFKDEYNTLISNIQSQVDNKADTYYQPNDPSINWTTLEEKEKHVGDLWRCTAEIK
jgi:hypothetical protein